MTQFWKTWLTIWCIGVGVFGLVLFGAGWPTTDKVARAIFALFGNSLALEPDRYLRFAISLMGAVTFGWAVTLYAAFRAAWLIDHGGAAPIWRIVTIGAAIWYVIDSTASIANGFAANAASNTIVVVAYLIPVLASGALSDRAR